MLHIHVAVSPPGHVRDSSVTATDNCAGAVVALAVMCVCVRARVLQNVHDSIKHGGLHVIMRDRKCFQPHSAA